jgi:hypothetical protein
VQRSTGFKMGLPASMRIPPEFHKEANSNGRASNVS